MNNLSEVVMLNESAKDQLFPGWPNVRTGYHLCGVVSGTTPFLVRGFEFKPWVWKYCWSRVSPPKWGPKHHECRLVRFQCGYRIPDKR